VPVLATLWLVLNLLDGVAQDNPAPFARVVALVVIGVALLAAGVSSVMTLWSSSFARFMYFEDRGMTQVAEIARDIPADRGLFFFGGILALIGVAALIAAAVVARRRGRAWR
jgi:multisubunit Na+/H+ antiporter MnhB subunit